MTGKLEEIKKVCLVIKVETETSERLSRTYQA